MKATFSMASLGIGGGAINRTEEKDNDDPLKKLQKDADLLRKTCFNNISAVYAKMGKWQNSLEKAKESLLSAQKVKDSAAIRNELRRVEAGLAAQQAKNDKRFRKAFKK